MCALPEGLFLQRQLSLSLERETCSGQRRLPKDVTSTGFKLEGGRILAWLKFGRKAVRHTVGQGHTEAVFPTGPRAEQE